MPSPVAIDFDAATVQEALDTLGFTQQPGVMSVTVGGQQVKARIWTHPNAAPVVIVERAGRMRLFREITNSPSVFRILNGKAHS
jgi:hypothetical protein